MFTTKFAVHDVHDSEPLPSGGRDKFMAYWTSAASTARLPSLARESFTVIGLKLTAEGACSRDRIAWAGIAGSFRLENCEHSLCAVSCPQSNNPSVGLAQRLR